MPHLNKQLEYNTYIVPDKTWDLDDFRVFHYYISKGWIIQDDNTKFMINPEWEGEEPRENDYWEQEIEENKKKIKFVVKKKEEDCIKVPDYDKHKLDKKCYNCGVGHMKQKTPNGKYSQLAELTNGKFICDGDECFYVMFNDIKS